MTRPGLLVNKFGLSEHRGSTAVLYTEQGNTVRAGIVPASISEVTEAIRACDGDRQRMWDYLAEAGVQWEWPESKLERFHDHFMSQEFVWGL